MVRLHHLKRKALVHFFIWVITMMAVVILWFDVGQRRPILGFAETVEHKLSIPLTAKLLQLNFKSGQYVRKNDVIALLSTKDIDAQIAIEEAELKRAEASIGAVKVKEQRRTFSALRGFAQANDSAEKSLIDARAELFIRSAELKALKTKRDILKKMVKDRLAKRQDLIDLNIRYAALKKEISAARLRVGLFNKQSKDVQKRKEYLPLSPIKMAIAPIEAKIFVIKKRIDRLKEQRKELILRSPVSGHISTIWLRPGEVARVGRPVVSIVELSKNRVVGCVYEGDSAELKVGMSAMLFARSTKGRKLKGRIVSLSPHISELPIRCWPQPRQRTWGRKIILAVNAKTPLLAGEGFNVRVDLTKPIISPTIRSANAKKNNAERVSKEKKVKHSTARTDTTKTDTTKTDTIIRAMHIPQALITKSRFEPSGILWNAARDRYFIVSDDTGYKQTIKHLPWIFSMDKRGNVDSQPLLIEGISKINDLESIAQGDNNFIYLLSSQSYSKKGKRKKSRQRFLRVEQRKDGIFLDRKVHLAKLLDKLPVEKLKALGLNDTKDLDIEGMTKTARGGLLIGLKSPLDEDGNALIWHLKKPKTLFQTKNLDQGELKLFGKVRLEVKADGSNAKGGISELLELDDRSLLITATLAVGDAKKSQTSSLWHSGRTVGENKALGAKKLRDFPNRKAEGMSFSADGKHIVVVFDAGSKNPDWAKIKWPIR